MIARDVGGGETGSMTRRSECITAVMVLPAAIACDVSAAESAAPTAPLTLSWDVSNARCGTFDFS
jgi:hypothetical protein